jgi:hypothetical protein
MDAARLQTLERALKLVEDEADVRQRARVLELDPASAKEAEDLFLRASGLRRARLALLERAGLR